ncbi:MAG: hypothetical protein R3B72_11750 [Polyangiaceae bacterium]
MMKRAPWYWYGILFSSCVFAAVGACTVDVIGEEGEGGTSAGTGSGTTSGTSTGTTTGTSMGTGGSDSGPCFGRTQADCSAAPQCAPLMRNDVVLPGSPPPPPDSSVVDPSSPCCWGCEEPACVGCHTPIYQGCVDNTYCSGLPESTCGYFDPGECP